MECLRSIFAQPQDDESMRRNYCNTYVYDRWGNIRYYSHFVEEEHSVGGRAYACLGNQLCARVRMFLFWHTKVRGDIMIPCRPEQRRRWSEIRQRVFSMSKKCMKTGERESGRGEKALTMWCSSCVEAENNAGQDVVVVVVCAARAFLRRESSERRVQFSVFSPTLQFDSMKSRGLCCVPRFSRESTRPCCTHSYTQKLLPRLEERQQR